MTYTQVWNYATGDISQDVIKRDEDNAFIPFDLGNIDYQEYCAWLDEGNEPNPPPADIVPPMVDQPPFTDMQQDAANTLSDHEQRLIELERQLLRR
jgi:hypothetical protein